MSDLEERHGKIYHTTNKDVEDAHQKAKDGLAQVQKAAEPQEKCVIM